MARKKRAYYSCDFETTTTPEDARVWAACAVELETNKTAFLSNNIDAFFEWLKPQNCVCYFHNLKFDGSYLLDWLLKNGYRYEEKGGAGTFEAIITDTGIFYQITVIFARDGKNLKKVVFYDSLKKLPFKVSVIAKAFNLEDSKLSIDYDAPRPVGHILTPEETEYILADCRIVAGALKIQRSEGLVKMTNASDALSWYKKSQGKYFEKLFPVLPLELDADIRKAYRGGWVYVRKDRKGKRGLQGNTYDVNSLYPSVMYNCLLPYGYPKYFEGEPQVTPERPLYIARIRCWFKLKEGHLPTIQLKRNRAFIETEYLESSNGEVVEMTVTNVDFELMKEHYDLSCLEFVNGWSFKGKVGMFKDYIDHWMHIKENSKGALRQLAKLMLNSLYGKFATNPKSKRKIPYLSEEGVVKYMLGDEELRDPVYTAMGVFITAYARDKTIRSAQSVYDRFIYADTDSLHITGYEHPDGLDIHPTELGKWKHEGTFIDSKFLRAKTYMETYEDTYEDSLKTYAQTLNYTFDVWRESGHLRVWHTEVKCAGMPENVKEIVSYDTFDYGQSFEGKLMPKTFAGGVVLLPSFFTIR